MQTIKITTPQNIDIDYEVAGLGERILGYLIDWGIFILLFFGFAILATILGFGGRMDDISTGFSVILFMLIMVFYDLLCEIFFNGQSIGKKAMKIRVISLNGSSPTVGQYLLRWMFRIVDITFTSGVAAIIAVALSENKQRIGDIVAGTTLIKTVPRTDIQHVAFVPPEEAYEPVFPEVTLLQDKDIVLIHEVINNVRKSGNSVLLYDTATRVKEHLSLRNVQMDDLSFLQSIIKDYNYLAARAEV